MMQSLICGQNLTVLDPLQKTVTGRMTLASLINFDL